MKATEALRIIDHYWEEVASAAAPNSTVDQADLKAVARDPAAPARAREAASFVLAAKDLFDAARLGNPQPVITSRGNLWRLLSQHGPAWDAALAGATAAIAPVSGAALDWDAKRVLGDLDRVLTILQDLHARLQPGAASPLEVLHPYWYDDADCPGLRQPESIASMPAALRAVVQEVMNLVNAAVFASPNTGPRESPYFLRPRASTAQALDACTRALALLRPVYAAYRQSTNA